MEGFSRLMVSRCWLIPLEAPIVKSIEEAAADMLDRVFSQTLTESTNPRLVKRCKLYAQGQEAARIQQMKRNGRVEVSEWEVKGKLDFMGLLLLVYICFSLVALVYGLLNLA
jgi:hypothetical protein